MSKKAISEQCEERREQKGAALAAEHRANIVKRYADVEITYSRMDNGMFYRAKLARGGVLPTLLDGKWTDARKLSRRIDAFKAGLLPEQSLEYITPFSDYKPNLAVATAAAAKKKKALKANALTPTSTKKK